MVRSMKERNLMMSMSFSGDLMVLTSFGSPLALRSACRITGRQSWLRQSQRKDRQV